MTKYYDFKDVSNVYVKYFQDEFYTYVSIINHKPLERKKHYLMKEINDL